MKTRLILLLVPLLFLLVNSMHGANPTVRTRPATNVWVSTATLTGTVDPNQAAAQAWFEWGTTTNYALSSAWQSVGNGDSPVAVSLNVSNLAEATTYYFRMVGSNSSALRHGSNFSFTTYGLPGVTVPGVEGVGTNAATLTGQVTGNGLATTAWFEWGQTTNYGNTTPAQAVGTNYTAAEADAVLGGLAVGTTYQARLVASNAGGLRMSGAATFVTTGTPPVAVTLSPTNVVKNAVRMQGSVQANGAGTVMWFEWGNTTNLGSQTTAQAVSPGTAVVSAVLTNLVEEEMVHYRVVASNALGASTGATRAAVPSARLVLHTGDSWTYTFHDLPFQSQIWLQGAGSTYGFVIVSAATNTWLPGTRVQIETGSTSSPTYVTFEMTNAFKQLVVGYEYASRSGTIKLTALEGAPLIEAVGFTHREYYGGGFYDQYANNIQPMPQPQPATLITQQITGVSLTGATLSLDVNANNLPTGVYLQWGATPSYGTNSAMQFLDYDYAVTRSVTLSNLAPGTPYYARWVATNSAGTNYGLPLTFETGLPSTVMTVPASFRTATSAYLNAAVTLKGLASTLWFEWGATTNYGQITPALALPATHQLTNVAHLLTGLISSNTHHYRALLASANVTNVGTDASFITTLEPTDTVVTNLAAQDVAEALERGGTVRFETSGTVVLASEVQVTVSLCVDATGQSVTFDGAGSNRLFQVAPGASLCLTNVTLRNGRAARGGAILNLGALHVHGSLFVSNNAIGIAGTVGTNGHSAVAVCPPAGLIDGQPGGPGGAGEDASGGAIDSAGPVTLQDCLFLGNRAVAGNGGNGGTGGDAAQISCSGTVYRTLQGDGGPAGAAGNAYGGAVACAGPLIVANCQFLFSTLDAGAGGHGGLTGILPWNFSLRDATAGAPGGSARGGAIYATALSQITASGFTGNRARAGRGGDMLSYESPIVRTAGLGGAAWGGAVFAASNIFVADCNFSSNSVRGGTGGNAYYASGMGGPAGGGGVFLTGPDLLLSSLFRNNEVVGGSGGYWTASMNGGVALGGAVCGSNGFALVNSTLFSNRAEGGYSGPNHCFACAPAGNGGDALGGGAFSQGPMWVTNVTACSNAVAGGLADPSSFKLGTNGLAFGSSFAVTNGTLHIVNTILAYGPSNKIWGALADLGHNLSTDGTPAWTSGTSLNHVDPLLLTLADNGGPTPTMALRAGSPALNAGDCASAPAVDQRGQPRPNGTACDIGAHEGPGVPTLLLAAGTNGAPMLKFMAEEQRAYRLEHSTTLPMWEPWSTNVAPSNGWMEIPLPVLPSPRFFRIMAE